ncbi:Lysosome-associated membrane glycoprotein 2 [Frankliniella fusca]|uniref:Lysosome-associated membrane glycoprotein 2 n=1 Tax=Frankliniella fusca TaxID=407009 RepID=A0AAE1LUV7_9NEOP|nr:Lysosome-associated membrane glycoprotein 2 [Frankliniella fusca]
MSLHTSNNLTLPSGEVIDLSTLTSEQMSQLFWNVEPTQTVPPVSLSEDALQIDLLVPNGTQKKENSSPVTTPSKGPSVAKTRKCRSQTISKPISPVARKKRSPKDKPVKLDIRKSETRVARVFKSMADICIKMAQICNESSPS